VKSVEKELTKKLDMTVALQKAEASAWANHKPQGGNDPRYEIVKAKGEAVGERNCTHEPTTPIRIGEGEK
jgi:hypothetical protein